MSKPPLPLVKQAPPLWKIERTIGIIALVAGGVLVASAGYVYRNNDEPRLAERQVAHSYQIISSLDQLNTALADAEAGERGFVLMGRPTDLAPFQVGRFQSTLLLNGLRPLVRGEPDRIATFSQIERLVTARLDFLARTVQMREHIGYEAARRAMEPDPGPTGPDAIRKLIGSLQQRERDRLTENLRLQDVVTERAQMVTLGTMIVLAMLAIGMWLALRWEIYHRKRLEHGLFVSATSDALTGALNRSEFERLLSQEWAFRMRYRTPLALLMLEVDNLQNINEMFGRQAGDAVLREMVRRLHGRLRTAERMSRFDGEQFGLLVPQSLSAALLLAKQLCDDVSRDVYYLPSMEKDLPVTVQITASIGVADASDVNDEHDLIQAAEDALSFAKSAGRNRAETYRTSMRRSGASIHALPKIVQK